MVDTVGSDHSHLPLPVPDRGQTFVAAPMGLPGMELRLPLVLSEGTRRGVPLERLAHVLSTGPAQAFGIHPRKGSLAPGSDADVVVWDPRPRARISAGDLHEGLGHSPYEGLELRGRVRLSVIGGQVFARDGAATGARTGARFVSPPRAQASAPDRSQSA